MRGFDLKSSEMCQGWKNNSALQNDLELALLSEIEMLISGECGHSLRPLEMTEMGPLGDCRLMDVRSPKSAFTREGLLCV